MNWVVGVGLAVVVLGCGKGKDAVPEWTEEDRDNVIAWSGIGSSRGAYLGGPDLFVVTVESGTALPAEPAPTARRPCVGARAFMPGPAHDPRLFYLVDEGLKAQGDGEVESLSGLDPSLAVTKLVALGREPGVVEMLVFAREGQRERDEPWLLEIDGQAIVAAKPAGRLAVYGSKSAYFGRFQVPKCKHEYQRCVVAVPLSGKASIIVEEPQRGEQTRPVAGFDGLAEGEIVGAKDVAWATGGVEALHVAFGCRVEG
ncbi:MAG: hypothetical protein AAGF11_40405 [Myxococcota bacterium]